MNKDSKKLPVLSDPVFDMGGPVRETKPWEKGRESNGFSPNVLDVRNKKEGYVYKFVLEHEISGHIYAGWENVRKEDVESLDAASLQSKHASVGVDTLTKVNEMYLLRIEQDGFDFYQKQQDQQNAKFENADDMPDSPDLRNRHNQQLYKNTTVVKHSGKASEHL
jgi:hypothetical protein